MVLTALAEIIGIGATLPFVLILTDPTKLYENELIQPIIKFFLLEKPSDLLLPVSVAFGIFTVIAALMRIQLLLISNKLSYGTGSDISLAVYRNAIYQEYKKHKSNSSEIIDAITAKTNSAIYLMNMTLNLLSSIVIIVIVLGSLIIYQPKITILLFLSLGGANCS